MLIPTPTPKSKRRKNTTRSKLSYFACSFKKLKTQVKFFFFQLKCSPHCHKLCSWVSHIWGNHRGEHIRNSMAKPRPGRATFVTMVSPLSGKYDEVLRYDTAWNSDESSSVLFHSGKSEQVRLGNADSVKTKGKWCSMVLFHLWKFIEHMSCV